MLQKMYYLKLNLVRVKMLKVNGQVYVTNLKEVSPKLLTGDVYCHEKVSNEEYNTTFVKAKFVGEALSMLYMMDVKNKDKIFIEKSILKTNNYTNKEGKKYSNLELTVFKVSPINNDYETPKGKFDR